MTTQAPERLQFKTELKQLLDLIIHSLYTKKEIFLRELISNAADAIDKLRFKALTEPSLTEGDSSYRIKLTADKAAGTLTISDNGLGMSREAIVEDLGTIARSGTKAFLENLKKANSEQRPELIGQFGVGFYSAYMVADRVTVVSRAAGSTEAVKWESDGQGEYTVEPADKATRGTDITLHLRDDSKEFLDSWRLRNVVNQYSDFIEHPVVMDVEQPAEKEGDAPTSKEETFNSRKAIWLRPKHEVKKEEYEAFYQQVSRDFEPPLRTIHVSAEGGATDFKALMYIPAGRPMDFFYKEPKAGLDLYVRRVLIQHECELLLPTWLRFVKGVVDSADLPLNVSRETLQHNAIIEKIKSNVVNRVLKELEGMRDDWAGKPAPADDEPYLKFYAEFGQVLKEGVAQDWSHKDRLADLLLFESTKTEPGKYTTLAKYVERMAEGQTEIYYLIGDSRAHLENSPYLENLKSKGYEVLLCTEPVDEFVLSSLREYKAKPLKAADRAGGDDKREDESFKPLLDAVKEKLAAQVKDVKLSARLKDSAAVLVADEFGVSAHFERMMKRAGRDKEIAGDGRKRILELNPDHPVVAALKALVDKDAADPRVDTFTRLLYEQAVIAEGSKIEDPSGFARRINELLVKAAAS
ncbi:MAG: molecular chaperone HtpG [Phycisphaerae bacterium]|nr:molecular chaperone HtpG [Tepidisphaeraceae bacterium]